MKFGTAVHKPISSWLRATDAVLMTYFLATLPLPTHLLLILMGWFKNSGRKEAIVQEM